MLISYVLRLRPDALAEGRFVGEIEAVTTRHRSSVRSVDQMAAFILETTSSQLNEAGTAARWCPDEVDGAGRSEKARRP